jgi:CYTH domain-containing protein
MPIPFDKGIREYENINISKEEFDLIWPLTKKRLEKTRYYISSLVTEIRVDIFHGKLEGLVLAEVVFDNEDTKRNFEIPK